VGGMQLDTPEHAVQLLLQAFEAMKEAQTSKLLHVEGNATLVGKEPATKLEVIDHMSKPTQLEVLESSKQAAIQVNRKEGGGKVSYCFRCKTKGHAIVLP
jgi:hypothetical protein